MTSKKKEKETHKRQKKSEKKKDKEIAELLRINREGCCREIRGRCWLVDVGDMSITVRSSVTRQGEKNKNDDEGTGRVEADRGKF